jgi:hypothetical protein
MIFGAGAPAPAATSAAAGAGRLVRVPILDDASPAPVLVGDDGAGHDVALTPGAGGKVDALVAGGGNSGRVTGAGVGGTVKLAAGRKADVVGLDFGRASRLDLVIATQPRPGVTRSLTAGLSGALSGGDAVAVTGPGAFEVRHGGGPAQLRLTLSTAGAGGAPLVFAGAPIRLGRGERAVVKPDWSRIDRGVTVTIRSRGHGSRTVRVANTARPATRVGGVRVKAVRHGRDLTVTVTARIGGARPAAAVGAIGLAVRRGPKLIARAGTAARGSQLRNTVLKLRLPAGAAKARLRLDAAVTTVGSGTRLSAGSTARGRGSVG